MVVSSCRNDAITLDAITCLSRHDPGKDIFKKVKKSQKSKRRNFHNLLDINDGRLVCRSESHQLDDICMFDDSWHSKKCTLDNTNNEVVELNYRGR